MRTSFDHIQEEDVPRPVLSLIRSTDGKHVDGHNRLRMDHDELQSRYVELEKRCAAHDEQLLGMAKRTTDISRIRFTPGTVVAMVAICASIIGGVYGSTAGIRDRQETMNADIGNIKAMMLSQDELRKADARLQDERAQTMSDAIKEIKARGEMTDLKVNNLRETMLTNSRR